MNVCTHIQVCKQRTRTHKKISSSELRYRNVYELLQYGWLVKRIVNYLSKQKNGIKCQLETKSIYFDNIVF